ncbi:MAG: D-alanyl-D-alanine carboxypeptidase family protein [Alphaproteobacteria bacterium]
MQPILRLTRAGSRLLVRLGLVFLAVSAPLAAGARTSQSAGSDRYAAYVMDVNSGRVLYSRNADSYRYPASLTKMMTLYLTFEAVTKGKLSMDDQLTVSAHAQNQAPSKLGLRAGDTISVKECVLALITKSANDAAVVLAERLGGSEPGFAELMTAKAHALGMSRTNYHNASGLPDLQQRTTAHDLALLGQSLIKDFPQYYGLFSTAKMAWNGRTILNHDHLLDSYEGTTGLKTGYTAMSGFNLATSVERKGYSLIGIVMGGRTAKARDDHMMQLLDMQFARLEGSPMLASRGPATAMLPTQLASASPPALNSGSSDYTDDDDQEDGQGDADDDAAPNQVPGTTSLASSTAVATAAVTTAAPIAAPKAQANPNQTQLPQVELASIVPVARPRLGVKPAVEAANFSPAGDPIGAAIAALTAKDNGKGKPPKPRPRDLQVASLETLSGEGDTASDGENARVIDWLGNNQHWGIQIGAFAAMQSAAARLNAAQALAPDQLKNATPAIISTKTGGSEIYKARFGPFEEKDARNACSILTSRGINCVAVRENDTAH